MTDTADWSVRLRAWYAATPALTHALTSKYKTSAGCNTYELLARELDDVPVANPTVVDLGCGGGDLYRYGQRRIGTGYWVGIDFVPEQIAAARRAFPSVDFRCEPAQATSLENSAVDAVLMHGVLGEITPLDGVIDEVARVLRPGGLFAATAQATDTDRSEAPGDPRSRTREGLASLFDDRFDAPRIADHTFLFKDTPDGLWEVLSRRSYQIGMLPEQDKAAMRDQIMAKLVSAADDPSRPSIEVPLLLVTTTKRRLART